MSAPAVPRRAPLALGRHQVWPPVVLAPMAGVTDVAYRSLCADAGLCVSEMVTARGLVEGSERTARYLEFPAETAVRSVQLYGSDPDVMRRAVGLLVERDLADAVDLNVGCPVPKVTRHGGGAALPYKRRLFARVVEAAVAGAAGAVPVTVKMRLGLDDGHLTYRDAGRTAEDAGAAWVALHARTAAMGYAGNARWDHIGVLADDLEIPVLGNGDLWEPEDALRMVAATGCAGVVVGRGCLGRPWLFSGLRAAFEGAPAPGDPTLSGVVEALAAHARALVAARGPDGVVTLRKHIAWYLKGFPVGAHARQRLALASSLAEVDDLLGDVLAEAGPDTPFPDSERGRPRGRTSPRERVVLPEGWLDDPDALPLLREDALAHSGG